MTPELACAPGAVFESAAGAVYEIVEVLRRDEHPYLAEGEWIAARIVRALARATTAAGTRDAVLALAAAHPGLVMGTFLRADPPAGNAYTQRWVDAGRSPHGTVPRLDAGTLATFAPPPAPAALAGGGPYRGAALVRPPSRPATGVFVALEYVRAVSLAEVMRAAGDAATPAPPRVARGIAVQLAWALASLHTTPAPAGAARVWHGRLDARHVVLDTAGVVRLLTPVLRVGPPYPSERWGQRDRSELRRLIGGMSAEEVMGRAASPGADLFRLGALLWELFAGRALFDGATDFELLTAVARAPIPSLAEVARGTHPEVARAVARLLAREPERRPESAHAAASEIEAGCAPLGVASPDEVAAYLGTVVRDDDDDDDGAAGVTRGGGGGGGAVASDDDELATPVRWHPVGTATDGTLDVAWVNCLEPLT